jgi:radical SAM superfamily enzyme YgiQ (UPF0313 family)
MKVYLAFPPNWTPTMPHLALPVLTAFLRGQGIDVVQRDLNAAVFDWVLRRDYLERALATVRSRVMGNSWGPGGSPDPELLRRMIESGPQLAAQAEAYAGTIRSPAFFDDPQAGLDAFLGITEALTLASLPFYPAALEFFDYKAATAPDSVVNIKRLVGDAGHNMFIDLFERHVIPDIRRERPDVVGISIAAINQMTAAMTLAHLIKSNGLQCHVTVGGPHITMLRTQLPRTPGLFDLIDSAVFMDGEVPLLELCRALENGASLSTVPNLIYREGVGANTRIRVSTRTFNKNSKTVKASPIDLDPTPDFDGLPLDKYLAPELILPLMMAYGCYHGKCAFCSVGYGEPVYYQLEAEKLVGQMNTLRKKYGARHVFFADEAMTPRNLRVMSAALQAQGAPMSWGGCARFDAAFSPELLQHMARGGCRMLLFGLETANERLSDHMDKGVTMANVRRVLADSHAAGIWNHTFFFFGFPTETIEEAQDTVNFVYANRERIHSASPGSFVLERYAPAHMNPARFGITRVIEDPARELAIYFDYETASGMDEALADLVATRFVEALPEKPFAQYYVHDSWRFLYASHLAARGEIMPPWVATPG